VFLCGGMDRPNIKNSFLTGVIEALVGKCESTKNDQENSKPGDWFHLHSLLGPDSAELGRDNQTKSDGVICTKIHLSSSAMSS
jgi:hypothetical protein